MTKHIAPDGTACLVGHRFYHHTLLDCHAAMGVYRNIPQAASISSHTTVWQQLCRCLPHRNRDHDAWWRLTGAQLATLLDAAGYLPEKQYEALLMHYHWTSPTMGRAPQLSATPVMWRSLMQTDGTPMDYLWKWNNSGDSAPIVSYAVEPIGQYAGTAVDPYNQTAMRELLYNLTMTDTPMISVADMMWSSKCLAARSSALQSMAEDAGSESAGTYLTATISHSGERLGLETRLTLPSQHEETLAPILEQLRLAQGLEHTDCLDASLQALQAFLKSSASAHDLKPTAIGIDNSNRTSLTIYFTTTERSLQFAKDILTLAGRVDIDESVVEDVMELFNSVVGLQSNEPKDSLEAPSTARSSQSASHGCAIKLVPGKVLPEITLHASVHAHCDQDDLAIATSLLRWLDARGRCQYGQRYLDALYKVGCHRYLHEGQGLQTHIGCRITDTGELDVTSHVAPEAYHAGRFQRARATRRRGDW